MLKKVFIIILIVAALLMVLSLFSSKKKTERVDSIEQHAQQPIAVINHHKDTNE
jgi:hypothetical protein